MKNLKLFLLLLLCSIQLSLVAMEQESCITSFNAGQGDCSLIYVKGKVPLLIDMGSSEHPERGDAYGIKENLVESVTNKILAIWSNKPKKELCVITTHPHIDHYNRLVPLLQGLRYELAKNKMTFSCTVLCGGKAGQYNKDFHAFIKYAAENKSPKLNVMYAEDAQNQGLFTSNELRNLEFLRASDCVTHVFVPQVGKENDSSIITRVKVNLKGKDTAAFFAGDATHRTKLSMYNALRRQGILKDMQADLMLIPHHGGESDGCVALEEALDPRVLLVSAGCKYKHPKDRVLKTYLAIPNRRIWNEKVMPHIIHVFNTGVANNLVKYADQHNALFRKIDNAPSGALLIATTVPLFTSWSNGTIAFDQDVIKPQLLEAPSGVTSYVALPFVTSSGFSMAEIKKICPSGLSDVVQLIYLIEFMKKELQISEEDIIETYKYWIVLFRQEKRKFEKIAEEFIEVQEDDNDKREELKEKLGKYLIKSLRNTEAPDVH